MAEAHGVVPGASWGRLPEALRLRWQQLACDRMREALQRRRQRPHRVETTRAARPASAASVPTRGAATRRVVNPCLDMQVTHGVVVGRDWGTLPLADRQRWTALGCDRRVNR